MILFIDACARKDSRTKELAEALLSYIPYEGDDTEYVRLYEKDLKPVTEEVIAKRDKAFIENDFSDPYFDLAKQFVKADTIIIAAPYWDLSFPAVLKLYIENISINGLTFRYDENGMPHGLCNGEKLYYVTTAGGEIGQYNFGYDYIKTVSLGLFGIADAGCIRAVGLDIAEVDEKAVLENAKEQLKKLLTNTMTA